MSTRQMTWMTLRHVRDVVNAGNSTVSMRWMVACMFVISARNSLTKWAHWQDTSTNIPVRNNSLNIVRKLSQSFLNVLSKLSQHCLKVDSTLSQSSLKIVSTLSPSCLNIVSKVSQYCLNVVSKLSPNCLQIVSIVSQNCRNIVLTLSPSCLNVFATSHHYVIVSILSHRYLDITFHRHQQHNMLW